MRDFSEWLESPVGEDFLSVVGTLTADQLERLKDYERRNKNRETLTKRSIAG